LTLGEVKPKLVGLPTLPTLGKVLSCDVQRIACRACSYKVNFDKIWRTKAGRMPMHVSGKTSLLDFHTINCVEMKAIISHADKGRFNAHSEQSTSSPHPGPMVVPGLVTVDCSSLGRYAHDRDRGFTQLWTA
jgi:hypothetical protein